MPQSVMTKTYAKYLRMGIIPRIVRGNWKDGDFMYSLWFDNVQYAIDDMGDYELGSDVSYILDCLHHRQEMINRHHSLIREIYLAAKEKLHADVWVRVGAGKQLNCTFGDSEGEFAHLVMDFIDPEEYDKAMDRLQNLLGASFSGINVDQSFILLVSGSDNAFIFKDFNHPQVDVVNLDDTEGGHNH